MTQRLQHERRTFLPELQQRNDMLVLRMITVTSHPVGFPDRVATETFKKSSTARKWCQLMKRNNWKVLTVEGEIK
jgi:hypothetical protein